MKVLALDGKEIGNIELPPQCKEYVRTDLIQRAVVTHNANKRQPYGSDQRAGMKASATISKRRRNYKGCYGIGISRVPRKILSKNGTRFNWRAAFAPGTVKGRRAHPPKAEKIWELKLNKKERRKAIRCALSAVMQKEFVELNHRIPAAYPFALSTDFQDIKLTKTLHATLTKLGLVEELQRCGKRKVRSGKGKARGRKYQNKIGPLLVVTDARCALAKSGNNIPGVEVVGIRNLNTATLTTGGSPGRLTLFTEQALKTIQEEKLFT